MRNHASVVELTNCFHAYSGCDCNPEGSLHMECDACTQQCECKSNVIGRRCDQCVENFYSLRNAIGCIGKIQVTEIDFPTASNSRLITEVTNE